MASNPTGIVLDEGSAVDERSLETAVTKQGYLSLDGTSVLKYCFLFDTYLIVTHRTRERSGVTYIFEHAFQLAHVQASHIEEDNFNVLISACDLSASSGVLSEPLKLFTSDADWVNAIELAKQQTSALHTPLDDHQLLEQLNGRLNSAGIRIVGDSPRSDSDRSSKSPAELNRHERQRLMNVLDSQASELVELLHDEEFLEMFMDYCTRRMCSEGLHFWLAVEHFRSIDEAVELADTAREIFETFIEQNSPMEISVEGLNKTLLRQTVRDNPRKDMFDSVQMTVLVEIRGGPFMDFLAGADRHSTDSSGSLAARRSVVGRFCRFVRRLVRRN